MCVHAEHIKKSRLIILIHAAFYLFLSSLCFVLQMRSFDYCFFLLSFDFITEFNTKNVFSFARVLVEIARFISSGTINSFYCGNVCMCDWKQCKSMLKLSIFFSALSTLQLHFLSAKIKICYKVALDYGQQHSSSYFFLYHDRCGNFTVNR